MLILDMYAQVATIILQYLSLSSSKLLFHNWYYIHTLSSYKISLFKYYLNNLFITKPPIISHYPYPHIILSQPNYKPPHSLHLIPKIAS